ncbi:unnamed protein product [Zymoseptoria tritici ST99CH_1A5]|uniref:Uncharacterized protein n=1 Tax=Zymoseptoria tritici ST99CH_1A5 TaxID=1276529 RepID=A0A1Y6M0N2_ZYMTR|nr:unnamed protein product [Zymoseptoria tritici ST99CH_1A5]
MTGNGPLACGKPAGTPNSFDAKSVYMTLKKGCSVYIYTDNNQKCFPDTPTTETPFTKQGPYAGPSEGCFPLRGNKVGKWKNASVQCGPI